MKPWHRENHGTKAYKETRYFGTRRQRTVVAMYCSKPQRHGLRSCVHLEVRIQSRPKVEAQGIRALGDLLSVDHRAFWRKHLRLAKIDVVALGKRLRGKHLNARTEIRQVGPITYHGDLMRAGAFLRNVAYEELGDAVNYRAAVPTIPGVTVALRRLDISARGVFVPMKIIPFLLLPPRREQ